VKYYAEGSGTPLVFLHGATGLPAFTPDLQELSRHFAVIAPLHPGFGTTGEENLHEDVLKLTLYAWDLLDALDIERPILVGHGFGGMLAAEMAALEPRRVRRLVLVAPAGIYLDDRPTADFFAMKPEEFIEAAFFDSKSEPAKSFLDLPEDRDAANEATIARIRGFAAAARFLWPLSDRGLSERLYRIKAPTLVLWGEADKIIPSTYADTFSALLTNARVNVQKIRRVGHMVLIEHPAAASAITDFCLS
jgi:pimeloyl-ACP methyl ester carboxylesterase